MWTQEDTAQERIKYWATLTDQNNPRYNKEVEMTFTVDFTAILIDEDQRRQMLY